MSDLFSSDGTNDEPYQQFLDWQRESGSQPPLSISSAQQRDLFTMFQQFEQFQRQQRQKDVAQELASSLQSLTIKRQQSTSPAAPIVTPPVAQHPPKQQRAQASAKPGSSSSVIPAPFLDHPAHSVAASSRRNLLPLLITIAVIALVVFIPVYFIFLSPRANLQVVQYQDYRDDSNNLRFIGLVKNVGNDDAHNIKVNADVLDGKGRIITSDDDSLFGSVLRPGQVTGFDIDIFDSPDTWAKVNLTPSTEDSSLQSVASFTVSGTQIGTDSSGGYVISGTVTNPGPNDVRPARVRVTAYDAGGEVVAVNDTLTDAHDGIDAGKSDTFSINIRRKDIKIDHYDFLVYADAK